MKKLITKLFYWGFQDKLTELDCEIKKAKTATTIALAAHKELRTLLTGIDVSVDVHESGYASSWAVISLQGGRTDYIKFVELNNSNINEIAQFLRRFERNSNIKIDASPRTSEFLRIERSKYFI